MSTCRDFSLCNACELLIRQSDIVDETDIETKNVAKQLLTSNIKYSIKIINENLSVCLGYGAPCGQSL